MRIFNGFINKCLFLPFFSPPFFSFLSFFSSLSLSLIPLYSLSLSLFSLFFSLPPSLSLKKKKNSRLVSAVRCYANGSNIIWAHEIWQKLWRYVSIPEEGGESDIWWNIFQMDLESLLLSVIWTSFQKVPQPIYISQSSKTVTKVGDRL